MKMDSKIGLGLVALFAIGITLAWVAEEHKAHPQEAAKSSSFAEESVLPTAELPPDAIGVNQPDVASSTVSTPAASPSSTEPVAPSMDKPCKRFADAEIVESRDGQPDADGWVERVSIVKTGMKYPLVRTVEKLRSADLEGEPVQFSAAVADHMVVRVKDGLSEEKVATIASQNGFTVRKKMLAPDTYLISFEEVSIDALPKAIETFNTEANAVQYAEPDVLVFASATIPNDPAFQQLWGLHQNKDRDIDAPEAWDLGQGSSNIVVAVIDTGIDYNHEDLSDNMWRNPGEIADNGLDDDENGFRDDVYGWDFFNEDSDPFDDSSHGTHCAGILGAVGNNGIGVVGVNWRVKLMAVKTMNQGGSGYLSDAVDAIYYATAQGVRLTSNSWGYYGFLQSMKDAIDNAGTSNILFVAAAGNEQNDNDTNPCYPSSYDSDNIISVTATDADDDLAWFSNYGKTSVDLGAPGIHIFSTVPMAQGRYASFSGTSMATPHVAGVAAQMAAYSPTLTAAQIKQRMLENTDRSSTLSGKTVTGGRVNAYKGLSGAVPLEPPAAPSALDATASSNRVELVWTDHATNETSVVVERRSGSSGFTVLAVLAANTTHHTDTSVMGGVTTIYRVKTTNAAGSSAYSSEASATVPGDADAWDPENDVGSGAILLSPITTNEASHGPHTLSGTDAADWFKVQLVEGNTYNFNSIGGSGDTFADVFRDEDGTQWVMADDDGGGGLMFMLEYRADSNAMYYIRVRTEPASDNAAYTIQSSMTESSNRVPEVSLTSPAPNAVYQAPTSIPLAASASDPDGSIAEVQFFSGTNLLFTDTSSPFSYSWTNAALGNHNLTALAVDNQGGIGTSATTTVSVVTAQPILSVTPTNFSLFVLAGQDVPSGSFTVANSGTGTMNYSLSEEVDWLSISPTNGSSSGTSNTHSIAYSTAGLATGTYSGILTITATGATDSPKTIAVTLRVSSSLLDAGLLAYYPFNGNANDESGNGHLMFNQGALLAPDRLDNENSAFSFNGQNAYMSMDDAAGDLNFDIRNENYTVAFWAKIGSLNKQTILMDRGSDANVSASYFLNIIPGQNVLDATCWDGSFGSGGLNVTSTSVLQTGSWVHVAMVGDTSRIHLYLNGVHENDADIPDGFGSTVNAETSRSVGRFMPDNVDYFDGTLDDIRIYNRALSAQEVWQLSGGRTVASIRGTISYSGSQTGPVVVVAGNFTQKIAEPGDYSLRDLPIPGTYRIRAFRDVNDNNQLDASEPYGEYRDNPIQLTQDLEGVNITLTDPNSVDAGLLAYYPFNGNANDESGHGHLLSNQGALLAPDRLGNENSAFSFNGQNAYMSMDDAGGDLNFDVRSEPYTVTFWAQIRSLKKQSILIDRGSAANVPASYYLSVIPGQNVMDATCWDGSIGSGGLNVKSTTLLQTGSWVHVAMVGDTSRIHLYMNGVHENEGEIPAEFGSTVNGETSRSVGRFMPYNVDYFDGTLDEIRIYNRALPASEIWQLYGGSAEASICGTVQYDGNQTGPLVVKAGVYSATLSAPGTYSLSNLPAGAYSVFAFCDANRNGAWDAYEPAQSYSNNPVVLSNGMVSGVDFAVNDPDTDEDGLTDAFEAGYGRYQIVPDVSTWSEAKDHALSQGGHLATITSATEWDAIQRVVGRNANGLDLWLGATDELQEGVWKWVTGEAWNYTRWYPGEPNNNENEDFLELNHPSASIGSWNDYRNIAGDPLGYLFEIGYYTDPTHPDTDGDGLNDGQEVLVHLTDPTHPDSDGDDLNDGAEIAAGTLPLDADSDDDGLNDFYEVVTQPCLNPLEPDTDHDGISDGTEVTSGSDPCSAESSLFSVAGSITYAGNRTGQVVVIAADSATPTHGLVAYYPFSENANDESGNGNHAVMVGATLAKDRFGMEGSAYSFDGVDDYGDAGNSVGNNPSNLTYAAWVKINARESSYRDTIITKRHVNDGTSPFTTDGSDAVSLCIGSRQLNGLGLTALDDHNYYATAKSTSVVPLQTWVFLAATRQGSAYKIYVNGILQGSLTDAHGMGGSTQNIHFMHHGAWGTYCNGVLDDVRIYNRALSPNEVAQLYQGRQYKTVLPGAGAYQISNVLGGVAYTVNAFMDCDGNGIMDDGEPRGSYAANPVLVTNSVTDVNIALVVPSTGWTMRATHALAEYKCPGTNTVACEVYFPTNRNLLALGWTVSLPIDWSLVSATGDGGALANPGTGEILFSSPKLTNNPILFTYDVRVPTGQNGPQAIAGTVVFTLSGAESNIVAMAEPHPLIVNSESPYHSSDFRNPGWVIDLPECNRTLSYWRSGRYGVRPGTVDGYAPNENSQDGNRHKADYQEPFWELDGEEALRVMGYWMAGGYHPDAAGVDGYAPGIPTNGSLGMMDIGDISALSVAPSTYVPGHPITLRGTLSYSNDIIGLLWRPQLPDGWTILSVSANGGTPEVVDNEILFTSKLPTSPLQITYVCHVPFETHEDALVQTDVKVMRQGSANPQSLFGMMAPNMLQLDTDGDGLTDWVETHTGVFRSSTDTGTDPNNPDTDGDGILDGMEIPAGTNPNSSSSAFKILSLREMAGDTIINVLGLTPYEVQWSSVEGKTYTVARSTNLMQGYSVIRSNILATPPVNTFIDSMPPVRISTYTVGVQ